MTGKLQYKKICQHAETILGQPASLRHSAGLQVKTWQVFSGTNMTLIMWIFYPVVLLSTMNSTANVCAMFYYFIHSKAPVSLQGPSYNMYISYVEDLGKPSQLFINIF